MHVLICGAGRVGQGIARRLAREKHEITIIDENADLVDQVSIDQRGQGLLLLPGVRRRRPLGKEPIEAVGQILEHPQDFRIVFA